MDEKVIVFVDTETIDEAELINGDADELLSSKLNDASSITLF